MADEKQTPIRALYDRICADIHAAYQRFIDDRTKIWDTEKDWMLREHKVDVRHARYVLETADLEARRIMLVRNMATMRAARPIAGVNMNVN